MKSTKEPLVRRANLRDYGGVVAALMSRSVGEAFGPAMHRTGEHMIRIPLGFRDVVIVADPAIAREVGLNADRAWTCETGWNLLRIGGMFRRPLLSLDFEEHRHDRLLMQQALTPARIDCYMRRMEKRIRRGVLAAAPVGEDVDLRPVMKRCTFAAALETFVGVKLTGAELDRAGKAFDDIVYTNTFVQQRARRYLERLIASWLPEKRAVATDDLMSRLCHARTIDGDGYTDFQIVQHMLFFLFAAHDTTTITTTNMAYYIGLNRKWQERARAQSMALPEVLEPHHVGELTELERITRETLRFRTPVPVMFRGASRETTLGGRRIRRRTLIAAVSWLHHTDTRNWPDPDRFNPDRFLPENSRGLVSDGLWMPFGYGAHKCIGMHFAKMEISLLFHTLLRNFEWETAPRYVLPTLQNSLLFSNGFPATVRRVDPATWTPADDPDEFPETPVKWGTIPNFGRRRALRRAQRDSTTV